MNTATRARKITSARIALSVISLPHDELTRLTLISSGSTPAASANLVAHLGADLLRLVGDLDLDEVGGLRLTLLDAGAFGADPVLLEHLVGVVDREVLGGHVPRDPALEVDAEVEPLRPE